MKVASFLSLLLFGVAGCTATRHAGHYEGAGYSYHLRSNGTFNYWYHQPAEQSRLADSATGTYERVKDTVFFRYDPVISHQAVSGMVLPRPGFALIKSRLLYPAFNPGDKPSQNLQLTKRD